MDKKKYDLQIAALLHDVGKIVIRANPGNIDHSHAGAEYLKPFLKDGGDILRAVLNHHWAMLKKLCGSDDDISYIVYEADNIASSTDRRKRDDSQAGFDSGKALENIFNVFAGNAAAPKSSFYLRGLLEDNARMQYPVTTEISAPSAEYQKLLDYMTVNFRKRAIDDTTLNSLLQIVEATGSYVPSSTAKNEIADISLYDHEKLTAAIAACMYDYFEEQGISDYRSYCFGDKLEQIRAADTYLLVSGDLSGIQSFIYTIPSKGALKSLRGRSFYLELMLENLVDEILDSLELSRCNLLYTGGGNFYLLLPNTEKAKNLLTEAKEKINDWLLTHFDGRLYLAIGWAACSANDFKADSTNGIGCIYRNASSEVAKDKRARYSKAQLEMLFDPTSLVNRTLDGYRECGICHSSARTLVRYSDDDSETEVCENCRNLRDFGEKLLKNDILAVFSEKIDTDIALPGISETRYLSVIPEGKAETLCANAKRVYIKNKMLTGNLVATRLWMGDYVTAGASGTAEFEELAQSSGGEEHGIKRLGVMRADVDNLGAAFMAGFADRANKNRYATMGRSTALSRQLSLFFKRYINSLCSGEINGIGENGKEKFNLYQDGKNKEKPRKVHIVYSGGDDMFIVGAWDELIELAIDIRHAFSSYTNGKLTFSAGIGLFPDKCPISEMARVTGEMEDYAKKNPAKNSVTLFGMNTEQQKDTELEMTSYGWHDFENAVVGSKLIFLQKYISVDGAARDKLSLGKGALYRLLYLIREADKEKTNLARFAYTIARMEPAQRDEERCNAYQEVRKEFYKWYQTSEDRKQLATAIELLIYKLR